MLDRNRVQKIKEIIKEFFEKMTFGVEIEVLPPEEKTLRVNLKTEEPQILIGQGGETLFEIQHLLKLILRKKISGSQKSVFVKDEDNFYIDLDINDYKAKKAEYLKELARSIADDVSLTKKERTLSPMSAYERRIVHLELAGRSDVVTESVGEEPERKIVVKPRP